MSGIINCQVCTEKINKSTRSLVQCKCEYTCCKSCAKMYLLSCSKNPHCMNCKVEWNREFMVINFDKNFINKPMKNHRENVLYEREIALLPMTQPFVEHRKKVNEKEKRVVFLRQELVLIYEIIKTAQDTQNTTEEYYKNYVNQMFAYEKEMYDLQIEIFQLKDNGIDEKIVKEFIRQCPNNTCKGFLSKNLHCELCQIQACADCHEIKSTDHVCNPDTIETIKSMKNNTKPCPKCATLIFKIEGCFKADTPILMWDQTIKMSQDIKIGDILIGDDGNPRKVLNLMNGEDNMYEIIQNNGMKYIVNSEHTMVFKYTGDTSTLLTEENISIDSSNVVEIKVKDYLAIKNNTILKNLFGYKKTLDNLINTTSIKINHVGKDNYYGWSVDGNKRFLLEDFTVVRNCDQMYCIQCHTAFSWKTLQIETGTIHNPHYFEWMRQQNNGQVPRNPLDIPCGREINARFASSLYNILDKLDVTHLYTTPIYDICLRITHIREVDKLKYYINPQNTNLDLRIEYMMNNMDQQKFKMELQRREKKNEKKTEIYNIIDMFVNCITDIFYNFDNQLRNDYKKYLDMIKKLIEDGDFSLDFKKKIQKAEYFQKVWRILEKNIKKENTELIIVLQTQLINIKNKFIVKLDEYCIELLSEIEYLKKYVNEQLEKLATIYNCKKLSFNNHFCLV